MKQYSNCTDTKHIIFNNKLRAAQNQVECAFGRLKAQWRILNRTIDVDWDDDVQYETVKKQNKRKHLISSYSHHNSLDKLYSYNKTKGRLVREGITCRLFGQ